MEIFLSDTAINLYATILGMVVMYVFDNVYNKPKIKVMVFEMAKVIEKVLPEGTLADSFLDAFVKYYEEQTGKKPSAGELKTAMDYKDKIIKLEVEKVF